MSFCIQLYLAKADLKILTTLFFPGVLYEGEYIFQKTFFEKKENMISGLKNGDLCIVDKGECF